MTPVLSFVLGLSALVAPLLVAQRLIRQEVPIMIGASLLLFALTPGTTVIWIGWGLGALLLLLAGIALHVVICLFAGRRTPPATPA